MSEALSRKGALVDGAWHSVREADGVLSITSPSDLQHHVGDVPFRVSHAHDAVAAARRAFPGWSAQSLEERTAHIQKLRALLVANEEVLARTMTSEMGKPLREARLEARALVNKIDLTMQEGLAFTASWERDGGKLQTRYRPHGVMAVIGPFNFPLHLAHGHIIPALLMGNTVVFKPSDLTPHSGLLYAQLWLDAGLPAGVVNVVPGDARVGAALVENAEVDGVLFTGSFGVGQRIESESRRVRPDRVVALELGGKNAAVVLDDAPLEKALLDVALSAFSTSGQRCTCVSRLIVTRAVAGPLVEKLAALANTVVVGHPLDEGAFMGPLASAAGVEKFNRMQAAAEAEGSACVLPPRTLEVTHGGRAVRGHYVAPRVRRVVRRDRASTYQTEELFGPDLAVHVVDSTDEAFALCNATSYGLSAGLWTLDAATFEKAARTLEVGCLTWNTPTVGSSSRLPFGGVKHSGNHRPAGILSTLYCAWPMALTRGEATVSPSAVPPGVPWKV